MLMFPPIRTQTFKQFQVCVDVKLTGAAAESRSEHHIPLSTSSLGSWKSAVEGARRSDRLITRWSVKSPSARFALQLQVKSDFYEAEVSSYIITAWSDDDELNCGVAPPWCQQAGRVFGVFFLELSWLAWWSLHAGEDVGGGASHDRTDFSWWIRPFLVLALQWPCVSRPTRLPLH